MTLDPTARAYAILGLRRGCTDVQLKSAYRLLVKQWHPDRYASDSIGQEEAATRMREINAAFQAVATDLRCGGLRGRSTQAAARHASRQGSDEPARPLTRAEIDRIVQALRAESPVDIAFDWLATMGPFALALILLAGPAGPSWSGTADAVIGAACLCLGIALLVRRHIVSHRG